MELERTRAQLRDGETELVSARERMKHLEDIGAEKESRINELLQQLHDQQLRLAAMTSKAEAFQRELHSVQQRCFRAESEHKEQLAIAEKEKSVARLAMEKSELSTLQGYVLREGDEFAYRCPECHKLLESPAVVQQVTREHAARLLSCLKDFTALSSKFSQYEQYALVAESPE